MLDVFKTNIPNIVSFSYVFNKFFLKIKCKIEKSSNTVLKSFGLEFVFLEKSNVCSSALRIVVMGSEMISEKNHLVM